MYDDWKLLSPDDDDSVCAHCGDTIDFALTSASMYCSTRCRDADIDDE